jgi:hypothetical protein
MKDQLLQFTWNGDQGDSLIHWMGPPDERYTEMNIDKTRSKRQTMR